MESGIFCWMKKSSQFLLVFFPWTNIISQIVIPHFSSPQRSEKSLISFFIKPRKIRVKLVKFYCDIKNEWKNYCSGIKSYSRVVIDPTLFISANKNHPVMKTYHAEKDGIFKINLCFLFMKWVYHAVSRYWIKLQLSSNENCD